MQRPSRADFVSAPGKAQEEFFKISIKRKCFYTDDVGIFAGTSYFF